MPPHHAVVHDDIEACRPSPLGRRFVDHAILQPDRGSLDGDGLVDDRPHEFGAPKDVDDVDRLFHIAQGGESAFAQNLVDVRIDRDDAIADPLQVARDAMAGPAGIRAETHYRNRPRRREDLRHDINRRRIH